MHMCEREEWGHKEEALAHLLGYEHPPRSKSVWTSVYSTMLSFCRLFSDTSILSFECDSLHQKFVVSSQRVPLRQGNEFIGAPIKRTVIWLTQEGKLTIRQTWWEIMSDSNVAIWEIFKENVYLQSSPVELIESIVTALSSVSRFYLN